MENNREGFELDIQKLLKVYLRRWWIILLCGIVGAGCMFVYTAKFVTPLYKASVTLYVNNYGWQMNPDIEYVNGSNISTAKSLVGTYINILKSDTVLEAVVEKSNLGYTAAQIRGMISAEQVEETEMFTISISSSDPTAAAQIANAMADVAPIKISEYVEGSSTKIIDYAKVPTAPYTPDYRSNVTKGFLVGVVVAVAVLTLIFLTDLRIKDASDLESNFNLPILGQIPNFAETESHSGKRRGKYGYHSKGSGSDYDPGGGETVQSDGGEEKEEKAE